MGQRGQRTTWQERLAIAEATESGLTDPEIAIAIGRSIWTVRKWRRRYRRQGQGGLASQMGRPASGVLSSYPTLVRDQIIELRKQHPGWGAEVIRLELLRQGLTAQQLPSRARIAALLKQHGLTRRYERHSPLPASLYQPVTLVHEEWQMDAQGAMLVKGLGRVSLINITDVVSRVKVESYPHLRDRGLTWADYQFILRRAFMNFGLPQRLLLDHDSCFYDNTSASPFPGRLHLWLVALGIDVHFGRLGRATDHAQVERMHQTMPQQAITGQTWEEQSALWHYLDERRNCLDTLFPCRSLAMRPPLLVYPTATHSGRMYHLAWEEHMLDLQRLDDYLAQGRWFRLTSNCGEFWLGLQRYNLGLRFARQTAAITFDPCTRELICQAEGSPIVQRFPIMGLTKTDLMGEFSNLLHLPTYQLPLPLSREDWRYIQLHDCLTDTTL